MASVPTSLARSEDPRVVKEIQVTTYHVLWELVHVFFERPGVLLPVSCDDHTALHHLSGSIAMSGVESLYPFLYSGVSDVEAVLADVCRSTTDKSDEITQLRADVLGLYRDQLMEGAKAMARSFVAGGRLFTFGNGGSSTDAQAIAELFQNPGPPARPLPAAALTTDVAALSALANDISFDVVFARLLAAKGRRRHRGGLVYQWWIGERAPRFRGGHPPPRHAHYRSSRLRRRQNG
jgi:hypothetical protein